MVHFGLRAKPVETEIPSTSLRAGSSLRLKNGYAQDDPVGKKPNCTTTSASVSCPFVVETVYDPTKVAGGYVSFRRWVLIAVHLGVTFYFSLAPAVAQDEPVTAEQIVTRYLDAIGADKFPSITTFMEVGDRRQSGESTNGTFEFYFKRPNLRFSSVFGANNSLLIMHGCDGKVTWVIDVSGIRREFKPKAGSEYDCGEGFQNGPSLLRQANVKLRIIKKKEFEGRMVWEIKAEYPKSRWSETFYIDAETYYLLHQGMAGDSVTYSDYRNVGGIMLPFKITEGLRATSRVTTVREVKINAPIDDARFVEPETKNGVITPKSETSAKVNSGALPSTSEGTAASNIASSNIASSTTSATPAVASVTEVNFPNVASSPIAELQLTIPDLKGLNPAPDQEKLTELLDRVGAKTLEIEKNTPNLISRENVIQSQKGVGETRRDYDYLIVTRVERNIVGLNEYRVDLKTGEKFQTDNEMNEKSALADLERASHELGGSQGGHSPASQGFATAWVYFYPFNRPQATFRYLGEQKLDGRLTQVLAFAQKPESVVSPGIFLYRGKTAPMFMQGVAWVDASDFRILRLRTDLLLPIPELSLHRLTADIQFVPTRIEEVPSLLSLPSEVTVTSEVSGSTIREIHKYSGYRVFRTHSKILLNP